MQERQVYFPGDLSEAAALLYYVSGIGSGTTTECAPKRGLEMAGHVEDQAGGWLRRNWVSLVPYGLNQQHPNNYKSILNFIWENRDNLGYAWRILRDGCCDGCALGTTGMRDWP